MGDLIGGRYRLDALLGKGGMGQVWAACHEVTGQRVALKFLRSDLAEQADATKRFLLEARAAGSLDHDHVIRVQDVFELDDGTPLMVMELLEGETLRSKLEREETLDVAATARIMVPVVDAIQAAHAASLVHRDLKPANIFLRDNGGAVVLDFGIAKALDAPAADATQTGVRLGTPCYMAPEQAFEEHDVDARADVWALGVILYECLVGARPIEAESVGQFLKHLTSMGITPIESLDPNLPEVLTTTIARMLHRDAALRPSLDEVVQALALERPEPPEPPEPLELPTAEASPTRRRRLAAIVMVLLALVGGGWWLSSSRPSMTRTEERRSAIRHATAVPLSSAAPVATTPSPQQVAPSPRGAPNSPPGSPRVDPSSNKTAPPTAPHIPAGMATGLPY